MPQLPRPVLVLSLALASVGSVRGQALVEAFAGGFSPGLGWAGDTAAFRGEDGRLRLDDQRDPFVGGARVWLPAPTRDAACWSLAAELAFAPSASNRAVWWLAADRPLDQPDPRGFYLRLGGISGSDDAFELFARDADGERLVAATAAGTAAGPIVAADLRVCRSSVGAWSLSADTDGGTLNADGTDAAPLAGQFVGLDLAYTSTRRDLFFFDSLTVDPLFVDREAPRLVLAEAVDATTVALTFNEPLDATSVNAANASVGNLAVTAASVAGAVVTISTSQALPDGVAVDVTLTGVRDAAGNEAGEATARVTYIAPRVLLRYDLLVSEIMADPSPARGLPEVEYLEVHNASAAPIELGRVTLRVGSAEVQLPDTSLAAGAYLALAEELTGNPSLVAFPNLPTLPNSGTLVALASAEGLTLDAVDYRPAWHAAGFDEGGTSLERVSLAVPCVRGAEAWASSTALAGGTPGAANAAEPRAAAETELAIVAAELASPNRLTVTTNRALAGDLAVAFALDGAELSGVSEREQLGSYDLTLARPLEVGQLATVALTPLARSCVAGESSSSAEAAFGLPERPLAGDWRVSEVMYDPLSGDGRWFELYNAGDRLLSTGDLDVAEADADGTPLRLIADINAVLVPPGAFVVLADDVDALLARFPTADPLRVGAADLPSFGEATCLLLFDAAEELEYELACWDGDRDHNRAYANTDGVSLERLDLDTPVAVGNWTSAAGPDFATPTHPNSQRFAEGPPEGTFALEAERVSPDGDGFEDLLVVAYALQGSGTLARFEVLDLAGRPVLTAARDEALPSSGRWVWDGVDDDGALVALGTYVVRVRYWSPESPQAVVHLPFSVVGFR